MFIDLALRERPVLEIRRRSRPAILPSSNGSAIPRPYQAVPAVVDLPGAPFTSGLQTFPTLIGATAILLLKLAMLGMFVHSL